MSMYSTRCVHDGGRGGSAGRGGCRGRGALWSLLAEDLSDDGEGTQDDPVDLLDR